MEVATLKHLQIVDQLHKSKQLYLFQQPQNLFVNLVVNPHEKSSIDPFFKLYDSESIVGY
jgi:hypothetical protein